MTTADATVLPPAAPSAANTLGIVYPQQNAGVLATGLAVAGRTVRKFLRTPQLLVLSTVQGMMFLLIFRYVFGGAIQTGSVPYVDYMVPGFVVTGVLFSGSGAAAGVAEDVEQGFSDRLRSLPVSRTALLAGRALADTGVVLWGLLIMTAVGFLVGFRIHGTVPEALAAFGLTVVFGFAFTWLFILIGLLAGTAQAGQGMSMLIFPFTFVSSAYVPVDSMPGWIQAFAEHQPVTAMVNAARSLALGDPAAAGLNHSTGYWIGLSLAWSAALVVAFAPLAVARYRA